MYPDPVTFIKSFIERVIPGYRWYSTCCYIICLSLYSISKQVVEDFFFMHQGKCFTSSEIELRFENEVGHAGFHKYTFETRVYKWRVCGSFLKSFTKFQNSLFALNKDYYEANSL